MISMKQDRSSSSSDDWSVVDSEAQNEDTVAAEDSAESEIEELLDSDLEIEKETDSPRKAPESSPLVAERYTKNQSRWSKLSQWIEDTGNARPRSRMEGIVHTVYAFIVLYLTYVYLTTPVQMDRTSENAPVQVPIPFCEQLDKLDSIYNISRFSAGESYMQNYVQKFSPERNERNAAKLRARILEIPAKFMEARHYYQEARQACAKKESSEFATTSGMLLGHVVDLSEALKKLDGQMSEYILDIADVGMLMTIRVRVNYLQKAEQELSKCKKEAQKKASSEEGNEWKDIEEAVHNFSSTLKRTVPKIVERLGAEMKTSFNQIADRIREKQGFLRKFVADTFANLQKAVREACKACEAREEAAKA